MEGYFNLAVSYIKKQYFPHLCLVLLLCLLSGNFMSFRNLEPGQCARIMEQFVSICGILLLTPLFLPEQDREILELERSKALPIQRLYLLRLLEAVLATALVVTAFVLLLQHNNPGIDAGALWLGSIAETMFLGSIGYFFSACTNQVVIGYMMAFLYFVGNIGAAKYFGPFGMYQMSAGNYSFWPWMLAGCAVLTAGGILIREK